MGPEAVKVQTFDVTAIHQQHPPSTAQSYHCNATLFLHNRKVENDAGIATFPFASCLGAALASATQQFHKIQVEWSRGVACLGNRRVACAPRRSRGGSGGGQDTPLPAKHLAWDRVACEETGGERETAAAAPVLMQ
jgi:hypothetical protein